MSEPGQHQDPTDSHHITIKQGQHGQRIELVANFFELQKAPDWHLRSYVLEFDPPLWHARLRKAMLKQHSAQIGGYIYDMEKLLTTSHDILIPNENGKLDLQSTDERTGKEYHIFVRYESILEPGNAMYDTFYNTLLRKCVLKMGLVELGKVFCDPRQAVVLGGHSFQLWPGFTASIRKQRQNNNILMCVDTAYGVIRGENVLETIEKIRSKLTSSFGLQEACADEIVGSTVITPYNMKSYRVRNITWDLTPPSHFTLVNGELTTFADFYKQKHNKVVTNPAQPLLLVDVINGDNYDGKPPFLTYLIPEFCWLTGLTESMKANSSIMRDIDQFQYLNRGTGQLVEKLTQFMKCLRSIPANQKYFQKWGVDFSENLVSCPGRILDLESIQFTTLLKKLMIVELYVRQGQLKATKGKVICSMVASAPPTHLSFYNTVLISPGGESEIEGERIPAYALAVAYDLIKIIGAYAQMNHNTYPEQIVIYRDGDEEDEGQLEHIFQRELPQVRGALDMFYKEKQLSPVEFTFVAVSRNTNAKFFNITQGLNPHFCTVIDDDVTLPERYDFYLTSKTVRGQGPVCPIGFNILYDSSNLSPDQLQGLTFKMCYASFNCMNDETENLEVSAVCQYARTMAKQNELAIEDPSNIYLPYFSQSV